MDELSISVFLIIFIFATAITLYLMHAVGLMKMAKNQGIKNSYLAFVPITEHYLIGKIINEEFNIGKLKVKHAHIKLPVVECILIFLDFTTFFVGLVILDHNLSSIITSEIGIIVIFLNLLLHLFTVASHYKLYSMYSDKHAFTHVVISYFIPFYVPFHIFSLRNKKVLDHKRLLQNKI
jgi:hypothetical protein